jgi:hypothetical protein
MLCRLLPCSGCTSPWLDCSVSCLRRTTPRDGLVGGGYVDTLHDQGIIWLEAEQFTDIGGWSHDAQFIDQMGSPYLLANGLGNPVADAVTRARVAAPARYRLWVRCKDWLPPHSPGQFQVCVNGQASSITFGRAADTNWKWLDGGQFDLPAGPVEVRLHDLTGWWGRCDAVALSSDPAFQPVDELEPLARQRERYGGISREEQLCGPYDVVVAGGGLAGTAAAISAARRGCGVALLQDRPVLGGNASTEIQVPAMGDLTYEPWDPRETGLIEEFDPQVIASGNWSANLEKAARAEPLLQLHLCLRVTGVTMDTGTRIAAVNAVDVCTGRRFRFAGRLFIDCTGDANVGFQSGADFRHGQEARSEFGEPMAPEQADHRTMSTSLNAGRFHVHAQAVDFMTPAWAYPWTREADFEPQSMGAVWNDRRRLTSFDDFAPGRGRLPQSPTCPVQAWYIELGGCRDTVADAEQIRDDLLRVSISLWGYIKNHHPEYRKINANRELVWLNHIGGKRESRRLMGDYILTQLDIDANAHFPDVVAYAGWTMDMHHPHGFFTAGPQAHLEYMSRAEIPYRSLYSRNIENLMMAGRNISVTHLALGKTRVMRTCFLTGWAAGVAAAIATREVILPHQVHPAHTRELQQELLKGGAYLPGLVNQDPRDLARAARVTASSFATIEDPKYLVTLPHYYWNAKHPLTSGLAVQFRAAHQWIDSATLFLRSRRPDAVRLRLTLRPSRWVGDMPISEDLASAEAEIPPGFEGWVEFPLSAATVPGDWYYMFLPRCPGLFWDLYKHHPPETRRGYQTGPAWSCEWGCHKFRLNPGGEPIPSRYVAEHGMYFEFRPENVVNGISRGVDGAPNSWAPDPAAALPQWLQLEFPEPIQFNRVHVAFQMTILAPRDYSVAVARGDRWQEVLRVRDNRLRRRVHQLKTVRAKRVRVIIEARREVVDVPLTPVCEVRLYDEVNDQSSA